MPPKSSAPRSTGAVRRAQRTTDHAAAPQVSKSPPLGGVATHTFMRRHWHKAALLIRDALPGFAGLHRAEDLFALASRDDVESRLVERRGRRWSLRHGPFSTRMLRTLPGRNWTLLVQGVNLHDPRADALLRRFDFLPYTRLDDLMVSYAAPGGGVGPHLDAYDVFLVQGFGRRRWRYGEPVDSSFRAGLPLKILQRFEPQHDDVLGPGDLLYLPPDYAHDGVAIDACTTYSIGFRAPAQTELASAFLSFLQDDLALPGRYRDPELRATTEPGRVDGAMLRKVARMLRAVRWSERDVARFLGTWLSEPKPSVFFDPPARPLAAAAFARRIAREGARLDGRTQMLYDDAHLFVNGTAATWPPTGRESLRTLANRRALTPQQCASAAEDARRCLHGWYADGFLHPGIL